MKKVTLEQKKEAVRIAIKGGDPVNYLRVCGSRDPGQMWAMIRAKLRKDNPEIFLKLPKPEVKQKEEAPEQYQVVKTANGMMHNINRNPPQPPQPPEQVPTVKVDGPLQIETKEPEQVEVVPVPTVQLVYDPSIAEEYKREQAEKQKITKPVNYDGFDVTAIRHHAYGELYRDEKYNRIDWRTPDGEEVSMKPEGWKAFIKDLPRALRVLGVDI